MAILSEEYTTEISGIENQKTFGVELNSVAFKILTDRIYSDSIAAIIRELSCNAVDSHKMAGTENLPFDLKCPTEFDPHFMIRDYGTGLSEEDVYNIYSNFFKSTKRNSNEFIGALGLGSKTPFAYADTFTITSYFHGTKSVYTAFLDQSGTPSIAKLMEQLTDEPNGLEIKVAVISKDFNAFKSKAESILTLFDPKPNTNVSIKETNFISHLPGVYATASQYSATWYAVQGNIIYPIERKHILNHRQLTNKTLYLFFEIGELSFTASRESLDYDEKTIKALESKLDEVYADVEKKYEIVKNLPSYTEMTKEFRKLQNEYGHHRHLKLNDDIEIIYDGIRTKFEFYLYQPAHFRNSGLVSKETYILPHVSDASSLIILITDEEKRRPSIVKEILNETSASYVALIPSEFEHLFENQGYQIMYMKDAIEKYKKARTKKQQAEEQFYDLRFEKKIITETKIYYIPTHIKTVMARRGIPFKDFNIISEIKQLKTDNLLEDLEVYLIPQSSMKSKSLKGVKLINLIDVLEAKKDEIAKFYEFDNIDVASSMRYNSHFVQRDIEQVLKDVIMCDESRELLERIVHVKNMDKTTSTLSSRIRAMMFDMTSYKTDVKIDVQAEFYELFPMLKHCFSYCDFRDDTYYEYLVSVLERQYRLINS